jgi:iron complex outermembrane receptor protein
VLAVSLLVVRAAAAQQSAPPTSPVRLTEEVVVQGVRADERTPVTKTDVAREAIELVNRGQEMPYLLASTPAVNVASDSGIAAGYSYFNIRGIGQTRLNITLDGVPLQDPEDQALYFANFGDFASVVDSIQLQRGIGTSGVGSASYGGSVNFASVGPSDTPRLELQGGGGSWGTGRGTVSASGPLGGGFGLYGRLSAQTSDGFRRHSGASQQAGYFGATRAGERSFFKLFGFVGREESQLAFLATDEAVLEADLRDNPLSEDERDDFGQDFVQAQYTWLAGTDTTLTGQAYYNGAQGWFRIRDASGEALQQYGIDGHFVGVVLGATHRTGRLELSWGAHANDFSRDHFMDVVGGERAYLNTGSKNELSSFLRAGYDVGRARLWADAQVRHARFEYRGGQPLGSVSWTFFNPKAGVRFAAAPSLGLYATAGRMSREPARSDMLNGEDDASLPYDLEAVEPESLADFELGADWRRGRLALHAGVYAMEFENEIALSGELTEVGLPARRNAGRSHRRGLELDASFAASPRLRLSANAVLSRNAIDAWTQAYDVYDEDGAWLESLTLVHRDVAPLLTPEAIVNAAVEWKPAAQLSLFAQGRYVSEAQLDNTGRAGFRTPSFFNLDLQASLSLRGLLAKGEPLLRVQAVNLLDDERIWPSGYSYVYFVRGPGGDALAGSSYYYPQATRSLYATLELRF